MNRVAVTFILGIALLAQHASALSCYTCQSGTSFKDCDRYVTEDNCPGSMSDSAFTIYGKEILLSPRAASEPACLKLEATGLIGGISEYAYMKRCFFNEESLCNDIQAELPPGFTITTCALCTKDYCNGAGSLTATLGGFLLATAVALLRK